MRSLETQRLVLREWQENDVCGLFEIMKSDSVIMGGWMPHHNMNMTEKALGDYIKNDDSWAIELKESKDRRTSRRSRENSKERKSSSRERKRKLSFNSSSGNDKKDSDESKDPK